MVAATLVVVVVVALRPLVIDIVDPNYLGAGKQLGKVRGGERGGRQEG